MTDTREALNLMVQEYLTIDSTHLPTVAALFDKYATIIDN